MRSDGFSDDLSTVSTPRRCPFSISMKTLQIHPATIINQMLLSQVSATAQLAFHPPISIQYPSAKVAISHDSDWCAVIREVRLAKLNHSQSKAHVG